MLEELTEDVGMNMSDVTSVFESVVDELLQADIDPPVKKRSDINGGYCSIAATEVYERLGEPDGMRLCMGDKGSHYWIEYDGMYYDAERTNGVSEWRELPYWKRHSPPSSFDYEPWVKYTGF